MFKPASNQQLPTSPPRIGFTILVATLALNILAMALPLTVLQVFDRVIPFEATETLFFFFLGLCLVTILEFALKWSRAILLGGKAESFETELNSAFIDATLNADPENFKKTTPAAQIDRLGAISQLRSYYGGQARILAIDLPFTLIFIAMIGLIGGWLVLVPIAGIALLLLFKTALTMAQSSVFEKRKELDARRYSFLVEVLSQIRTLKANTMEPQMQRRYELLQQQTADSSHQVIQFSGLSQTFGAIFSQLAVAAMGLFGAYLVITQHIGIAELAACMLLNGRTVQPMLKALGLWAQSESLAVARAKISEACDLPQKPAAPALKGEIKGHVQFNRLGVKHYDRDEFLFRNIQGNLHPGQCGALEGVSEPGKTSFLKVLLAETVSSEGEMLIDGRPTCHFAAARGAGGIVYCGRNPVVFSGTVLDNISAFGDGNMIASALEISEQLGLDKTLHRLPMGYNTSLQESRSLLDNRSFLQRVTLVRALALRPRILLLNNVTDAMDDANKQEFYAVLSRLKGDTTIVMTDSESAMMQIADTRIHMDHRKADLALEWVEDAARESSVAPLITDVREAG